MSKKYEAFSGSGLHNYSLGEFDDQDYEQWRALIEQRAGLQLADHLRTYLQSGLNRRMKKLDITDYETYLEFVTDDKNGIKEWSILIDSLTVQASGRLQNQVRTAPCPDGRAPHEYPHA